MLQLASFIQNWWLSIQKFFHEMDIVLKCLIVGTLLMIALLGLVKLLKEKEKFKVGALIVFIIFTGLACLIAFI